MDDTPLFSMNFTFDLNHEEHAHLFNMLMGPYDWAKEPPEAQSPERG